MRNNLAEEFYKFYHQKTFFYGILTLLFLMFYGGMSSNVNQATIAFGFGAIQWIPIIIIAIGSSFFEMEYRNNTILMLLYKNSSKLKIYIAKFLTIFLYGVFFDHCCRSLHHNSQTNTDWRSIPLACRF
ncbi:ABC transporter permease [Lacticaseibacillus rhamnosus]